MLTANKIIKQFSNLKPSDAWSFADKSRAATSAYTHSYHRYPAKFIPQIVDRLVNDYTKIGDVVLDPFGGCGTTLVESQLLGRNSVGTDVNPIAKLITQVKVTPIKPKILQREVERVLSALENYAPTSSVRKSYRHERLEYWFEPDIIQELDYIYKVINKTKNTHVRRFFLVAFSHNLKNASRWLMKSIKPTIDKKKIPQSPCKSFSRHLKSMMRKNKSYYETLSQRGHLDVQTKMYKRDATRKTLPIENNSVNLIVTSPPYVTSYEYADLHQLSLLWFGNDPRFKQWNKHVDDFSRFRKEFIGTKHKGKGSTDFNSKLAEQIIKELIPKKNALSVSVGDYFSDMNLAFIQMYRVLQRGGHACVVIGNTNLKGVDILNAEVAAEQMSRIGFEKVKFIKREAASNKAITPWRDKKTSKFTSKSNQNKKIAYQYEYIIIMKKP